jgi:hypothetical protein
MTFLENPFFVKHELKGLLKYIGVKFALASQTVTDTLGTPRISSPPLPLPSIIVHRQPKKF